jgi:hypothetical protein
MKDWVKPDRKLILLITVISTLLVWAGAGLQTIYANFDGPYYIVVAKSWYNSGIIRSLFSFSLPLEYYPAHLPLYPLLINLVSITGINHLQSMLLVNLGATLAAAWVIFEISKRLQWGNPFWITLAWLFWWPRMWAVRSVGSPETLFIMTNQKILAVRCLRQPGRTDKEPGNSAFSRLYPGLGGQRHQNQKTGNKMLAGDTYRFDVFRSVLLLLSQNRRFLGLFPYRGQYSPPAFALQGF